MKIYENEKVLIVNTEYSNLLYPIFVFCKDSTRIYRYCSFDLYFAVTTFDLYIATLCLENGIIK